MNVLITSMKDLSAEVKVAVTTLQENSQLVLSSYESLLVKVAEISQLNNAFFWQLLPHILFIIIYICFVGDLIVCRVHAV